MSNFLRAVKAGVGAALNAAGPRRYRVGERALLCTACGHDQFVKGEAQLQTAGMTFVGLDWTQREATTLACARCSHLAWFLDAPEALP